MNKRQRKKAITKFYHGCARLTANDKACLSQYFGVKIIMSGQEIRDGLKHLAKVIVRVVDNFTPMLKIAFDKMNTLSGEINE